MPLFCCAVHFHVYMSLNICSNRSGFSLKIHPRIVVKHIVWKYTWIFVTIICISAAYSDAAGPDEASQSVSDGDPPSSEPEPVTKSPSSSSGPVGPDGMLLFSYCSCNEFNLNHRLLDQQLDSLCLHAMMTVSLWKCKAIHPGVIFIWFFPDISQCREEGSVQPSKNYSAPLWPDGMPLFALFFLQILHYLLFCLYTVYILFLLGKKCT